MKQLMVTALYSALKILRQTVCLTLWLLHQTMYFLLKVNLKLLRFVRNKQHSKLKLTKPQQDSIIRVYASPSLDIQKLKRLVVNIFDRAAVTTTGIKCKHQLEFTLDNEGFKEFINYFPEPQNRSISKRGYSYYRGQQKAGLDDEPKRLIKA